MKHLVAFLLCVMSIQVVNAQSISLFGIDASNFPTMKGKFYAFDAAGQQQRPGISELTLTENGQSRAITSVSCPNNPPSSLSVCIMVDANNYIEIARKGSERLVNFLTPTKDEIGITIMNHGVQILRDFTKDLVKAATSTTTIPNAPGVDIQSMFYYPIAGGVPFISGRTSDKKILILISDLHCPKLTLDEVRLYQDAAKYNISVYSVLLGSSDYSGLFKRIAAKTGGKVFEFVTTETQITNIFQEIERREHNQPCDIVWESGGTCKQVRITNIGLEWNGQKSNVDYILPSNAFNYLQVTPSSIAFGRKIPLTSTDTTITLTAMNADFKVTDIKQIFGSSVYSVPNVNYPIIIPKNTSKDITLRFTPLDSNTCFGSFEITTDVCPSYFGATGGFPNKTIKLPTLKVIHPNGGEVFVAGSDTVITWEGVAPSDTVTLDYSFDNGQTWRTITDKAIGLKYVWKDVPLPTSTRCLVRVMQFDNTSNNSVLTLKGPDYGVYAVAFKPDGNRLLGGSAEPSGRDGYLQIWDANLGTTILSIHRGAICVAYSPDGNNFAAGQGNMALATLYDANTGNILKDLLLNSDNGVVSGVAYSPNGNTLALTSYSTNSNLPTIWDAKTGIQITTLGTGIFPSQMFGVSYSPEGSRIIVACGGDKTGKIWDLNTRTVAITLSGHLNAVFDAAFSPDGNRVVTGSDDGTAKIWDANTGVNILTLSGHTGGVRGVAYSPDGSKIATASLDSTAKIWDANTGNLIRTLKGHKGMVFDVAYSPDGSRMATGSADGTAKIWDIDVAPIQQDISDSLFSIIAPQPVLKVISVDMGQVLVGDDKDSTVSALLCNVGTAPLHVLGIDVTSGDTSDFMIPRGAGDFYLAPNECRDVMFEFMTTKVGGRRATATIRTTIGDFKDTVEILGEGVAPSLSIVSSFIDFGKVTVGSNKDSSKVTTVKNIGSTPISITQITYNTINTKDFSTLVGGNPLVLQPNEEAIMDLRFLPTDEGRTSGLLEFHYNGIGSPAMVQLFGEGIKRGAKIAAAGLVVPPFACEVDKIDTLRIRNQGTDTLNINSASIGGMNPTDFQFVTPFSPSIVLPDSTLLLPIKFVPASSGTRSAVLEIHSNSLTDSILTISLSGRKDIAAFSTNTQILDLGTLCPNQTKDTILTLTNTGTVDNTLRIQTTDLILGSSSVYLSTSQNKPLTVRLNGQATEGAINEVITITDTICGTKLNIQVVGNIKLPTITSQRVADFGSVAVGASSILEVITVNTGTRPIVVIPPQGVTLPFTLISLTPPAGSILAPNDTLKARIRFDAVSALQSTGRIDWSFAQPCSIKDSTELRGLGVRSDTARTTIIAQDITAQVGEKVNLILTLQKSTGMQIVGAPTDWYASIHYNKSILFNEQTQNVCAGTDDSCVLELSGKYNTQTDELISIPCVATLGSTDHSMISIDNFRWLNSSIVTETQTQNGTITITGTCEQGGVRLLIPSTTVTSLTTRPNPAQNSLQVQYGLREPLTVTLELLNMTGQVVQTIFRDQQKTEGQYLLTSDLSTIGNGLYILRLTTNRGVLTTWVEVVK